MSSDLERRLEALFAQAPEPDPGAREEALHRALRVLHPAAPTRRGLRTAALALATAVVLLVIAAGSLAAAGALHVSFGAKPKRVVATQLSLPQGADGAAAIVDGRLSVVTKGGFRLQGLPAGAVTLSPHALFIAAGIGDSLVAMAPNGRRAWSHPAGGRVVAIAWAPDALRIAYIVERGRHLTLHVIWGTGTHDATIDASVRAVQPSWRSDSLAFAYVGAGGKAVVYDLEHRSHRVTAGSPSDVAQVAFAPDGRRLALLSGDRVVVGRKRITAPFAPVGIGWLGGRLALAGTNGRLGPIRVFGRITAFQSNGNQLAAVVAGGDTHVLAGTPSHLATVLSLPAQAKVEAVVVR